MFIHLNQYSVGSKAYEHDLTIIYVLSIYCICYLCYVIYCCIKYVYIWCLSVNKFVVDLWKPNCSFTYLHYPTNGDRSEVEPTIKIPHTKTEI